MVYSQKLKQLIQNFKQLKYSHNTFNNKTHEQGVEKIIIENGFIHTLTNKNDKNDKNDKNYKYYYISQPNGSQKPPDFRVFDGDEQIDIECKSKKTGYKPMWNSSIPCKDTFYIFTNQKDDKTLIIEGKNIITLKLENILNDYKKETKLLEHKYNKILKKLSETDNPCDIGVYARNMFQQNKHFNINININDDDDTV